MSSSPVPGPLPTDRNLRTDDINGPRRRSFVRGSSDPSNLDIHDINGIKPKYTNRAFPFAKCNQSTLLTHNNPPKSPELRNNHLVQTEVVEKRPISSLDVQDINCKPKYREPVNRPDFSLLTSDISGAHAKRESTKPRNTNPLCPKYKLPKADQRPITPPRHIPRAYEHEDMIGVKPQNKLARFFRDKDPNDSSDIAGTKPRKLHRKSNRPPVKIETPWKTSRHTDPLDPVYQVAQKSSMVTFNDPLGDGYTLDDLREMQKEFDTPTLIDDIIDSYATRPQEWSRKKGQGTIAVIPIGITHDISDQQNIVKRTKKVIHNRDPNEPIYTLPSSYLDEQSPTYFESEEDLARTKANREKWMKRVDKFSAYAAARRQQYAMRHGLDTKDNEFKSLSQTISLPIASHRREHRQRSSSQATDHRRASESDDGSNIKSHAHAGRSPSRRSSSTGPLGRRHSSCSSIGTRRVKPRRMTYAEKQKQREIAAVWALE
jgi:hypothetical protein